MQEELRYQIALTKIPQIGNIISQNLMSHFGNASSIFKATKRELERLPEMGSVRASAIRSFDGFEEVDKELNFIERYGIMAICSHSPLYPRRLLHCHDNPFMLYYKGNADLNATRIINVIGTRTPGSYGRRICEKIVGELAEKQIIVVSGLAYGIDVLAHETALKHRIPTIGVLAHGLDTIYPYAHKDIAKQMVEQGGLLTEYGSGVSPDKQNFPRRNRIVAGMADATVLIESNIKGGSMITAYIANSYNRDVFAIPGQIDDIRASGCNQLIRDHQAMIITSAQDIFKAMNWDDQVSKPKPPVQKELFVELSQEEKMILAVFRDNEEQHLEQICRHSQMPGSKVASLILNLEMQHMLKSLPGQRYQLA